MKLFATAAVVAFGCAGGPPAAALTGLYTYNALTCPQLQQEAALMSIAASAALGRPSPSAPRADPQALLVLPWPDPSPAGSARALDLKARMDALARAARAKSCAIRFMTR